MEKHWTYSQQGTGMENQTEKRLSQKWHEFGGKGQEELKEEVGVDTIIFHFMELKRNFLM